MIDLSIDENLKKIINAPNDKIRDGLAAVFYGKAWKEMRHEVSNKIKCAILTSRDILITKMNADTSYESTKYEFCCVTEHFDAKMVKILNLATDGVEVSNMTLGNYGNYGNYWPEMNMYQIAPSIPEITITMYDTEFPDGVLERVIDKMHKI